MPSARRDGFAGAANPCTPVRSTRSWGVTNGPQPSLAFVALAAIIPVYVLARVKRIRLASTFAQELAPRRTEEDADGEDDDDDDEEQTDA
ncbi:hypothetical protein CF327_g4276 [Tilletia walkeri]|uniref:Uncharacterized protein n=1 Tax=Tilletia walkeri TaxID=117179 RepID=A0A8X7N4U9_9BASI|nr:hypothetical protein CF327_g4276 [Tilletia walkeri]KAE8266408.1 hypothetical protein A4X09_0g5939 [Tilletia walkeri]